MPDLDKRVAVVTGASTGLGFAAAKALARRGARLAISSRGGAKLERAATALAAGGGEGVPGTVLARPVSLNTYSAFTDRTQRLPTDDLLGVGSGRSEGGTHRRNRVRSLESWRR